MDRFTVIALALLLPAALIGCDRRKAEKQMDEIKERAAEEAARAKKAASKALPEDVKQRLQEGAEAAKADADKAIQQAREKVDELRTLSSVPAAPKDGREPQENTTP